VEENESRPLLKYPGTHRCRWELLKRKWPHFKEEVSIRKIRNFKKPLNWES
jgi:hypothetical protein